MLFCLCYAVRNLFPRVGNVAPVALAFFADGGHCFMKMPFGKYRGRDLSDMPTDYLEFLLRHGRLWLRLRLEIEGELERRAVIPSDRATA
jgi:hypothetical protein